jgi:hypothetical protein
MSYSMEIQAPGGQTELHELQVGALTIGGSEDAGEQLLASTLGATRLVLDVKPEHVKVQLPANAAHSFVFDGLQVREAIVPWGGEIFASGVRLSFLATDTRERRAHPLLLLALAASVVALAWSGGGAAGEAGPSTPAVEPPELAMPTVMCPEQDPGQAFSLALREELAAGARQARYPFDAREGLLALGRLQAAVACFDAGHATDDAKRIKAAHDSLQRILSEDLAAGRLRLDRALEQRRPRDALKALRGLDALVEPLGDTPYRAWLRGRRRGLERQLAEASAG